MESLSFSAFCYLLLKIALVLSYSSFLWRRVAPVNLINVCSTELTGSIRRITELTGSVGRRELNYLVSMRRGASSYVTSSKMREH